MTQIVRLSLLLLCSVYNPPSDDISACFILLHLSLFICVLSLFLRLRIRRNGIHVFVVLRSIELRRRCMDYVDYAGPLFALCILPQTAANFMGPPNLVCQFLPASDRKVTCGGILK